MEYPREERKIIFIFIAALHWSVSATGNNTVYYDTI